MDFVGDYMDWRFVVMRMVYPIISIGTHSLLGSPKYLSLTMKARS